MTETRKKIIELIEPYMDKTLTTGTYLENYESKEIWIFRGASDREIENLTAEGYLGQSDNGTYYLEDSKILGTYDYTAILKYINDNILDKDSIILSIYGELQKINTDTGEYSETIFETNNKPLHLYTEEKEKELLEILLHNKKDKKSR